MRYINLHLTLTFDIDQYPEFSWHTSMVQGFSAAESTTFLYIVQCLRIFIRLGFWWADAQKLRGSCSKYLTRYLIRGKEWVRSICLRLRVIYSAWTSVSTTHETTSKLWWTLHW